MSHAKLLEAPVGSAVWGLAWPVIALGLLRSGSFLAGAYWAGRLGDDAPAALAAMGGATFAVWSLASIADLAATGVHALAARAEGAGDRASVGAIARDGAVVTVALGLVLGALARPIARAYFDLLGFVGPAFGAARALGEGFLEVTLWGAAIWNIHTIVQAVFRATGDTRTPTAISVATLALNAALDPLLMLGWGSLPALGLSGAAWATMASNAVGLVVSTWVLARRGVAVVAPTRPRLRVMARVVAIGTPVSLSGVGFCLVYVALGDVLARFGPSAVAGIGLGQRVESPTYQIAMGFAAAAATLVGQHLGAGQPREAVRAAHRAAQSAALFVTPFAVAFVACPRALVAPWAPDPDALDPASGYVFAVGLTLLPMALELVYDGAFAGAGDTTPAMLVILTLTAVRVPLAAALSARPELGLWGVWVAISSTSLAKGLLLWGAFAWRGRSLR